MAKRYGFPEVAMLLVGLALLLLSVPRLWAYGTALPEDGQYWRLGQGEPLSAGELTGIVTSYEAAADRFPSSPELQSRAAVASIELGLRQLQSQHVREGRSRLIRAASRAPLRTDIWSRLAYAEFAASGGMTPLALDALKLSFLTGRLELPDAMRRMQLYLSGWDQLPPEARDDAKNQMTLLWQARHVAPLARLYLTLSPDARQVMRELLPDRENSEPVFNYRIQQMSSLPR